MLMKSRGFTLVEVLVALVVLTLMALLAWRGIDALLTSRQISEEHLERSTRLQTVLQQWEQDLLAVQDSGTTPALAFDGASLRMTRRQAQGLQVVAWSLREGQLYRWAGPAVQSVPDLLQSVQRSQQFVNGDSQRITMLDNVGSWQVYFYRGNSWSNAQSSDGVAPPPAAASSTPLPNLPQTQVPAGVRMVIEFAPGNALQGRLTKTAMLGAQS